MQDPGPPAGAFGRPLRPADGLHRREGEAGDQRRPGGGGHRPCHRHPRPPHGDGHLPRTSASWSRTNSTASAWPSGRPCAGEGTPSPHPGDVRHAHPPDPGPDPLRGPGRLPHRRAAAGTPAHRDLRRAGELSAPDLRLPSEAHRPGPSGLHRLPHGGRAARRRATTPRP